MMYGKLYAAILFLLTKSCFCNKAYSELLWLPFIKSMSTLKRSYDILHSILYMHIRSQRQYTVSGALNIPDHKDIENESWLVECIYFFFFWNNRWLKIAHHPVINWSWQQSLKMSFSERRQYISSKSAQGNEMCLIPWNTILLRYHYEIL